MLMRADSVAGTSFFKGADSIAACVPKESQLSPDAGQIYFSAAVLPELTVSVAASTLDDCIRACLQGSGCLLQFDASKAPATCNYAALPWDPEGKAAGHTCMPYIECALTRTLVVSGVVEEQYSERNPCCPAVRIASNSSMLRQQQQ